MRPRIIWQYWETVGQKPAFVDGLHEFAQSNSGAKVIVVTPATLDAYLPELPRAIHDISQIEHKSDMIRAMLVKRYGGMWLDSDAVVLRRLDWMFDLLDNHEFVCFNRGGRLDEHRPWVRVSCFCSRPAGQIVSEWVLRQCAKFPRIEYGWEEIGSALLHPICLQHRDNVVVLPFEQIAPIAWQNVDQFLLGPADAADQIVQKCDIVMLHNSSLRSRLPVLCSMSIAEIATGNHLLGAIMRHAMQDSSDLKTQ